MENREKKCFVCLFNNSDMSLVVGIKWKKNFVAMLCDAGKQEFAFFSVQASQKHLTRDLSFLIFSSGFLRVKMFKRDEIVFRGA